MAMASHSKQLSIFFLILLFSTMVPFPTEARFSMFFNKFIHTDNNNVPQPTTPLSVVVPSPAPVSDSPELPPTLAPSPEPEPFFDQFQNAYGLYGSKIDNDGDTNEKFSSTTEESPSITDVEEQILAEDTADENHESGSGYPKTNSHTGNYSNSRDYYQYQSNNYRSQNGYEGNYRDNHYNNNYRENGYESTDQPQGMSDTRFLEKGRYFYDLGKKSSMNGYGFRGSSEEEESNFHGNDSKYPNEFDSMEEYENQEQEYLKNHEFNP